MINKFNVIKAIEKEMEKPGCGKMVYELFLGYGIYYKHGEEEIIPGVKAVISKTGVIIDGFQNLQDAKKRIRKENLG